jgi:hypothetical protein
MSSPNKSKRTDGHRDHAWTPSSLVSRHYALDREGPFADQTTHQQRSKADRFFTSNPRVARDLQRAAIGALVDDDFDRCKPCSSA